MVARLSQVTGDLTIQRQRRSSAFNAETVASLDEIIALLKRQARALEGEIASLIDDDPLWSQLDAAIRTKGIANRTVARMFAELPEIGIYSNKAVVKLADDAAAGQPAVNDLGVAWAHEDFMKAQGNKEYAPFAVTIDPTKITSGTVTFYWRAVSKNAA